jgi:nicotinate-nucleotide adenylyltransferase
MATAMTDASPLCSSSAISLHGQTAYYFGTFDPIHAGHEVLAQAAVAAFGLGQVVFVPTGLPPHRWQTHRAPQASSAHRLAMVQAAIQHHSALAVSSIETTGNKGPHYTVDTLSRLIGPQRWQAIDQPTVPVIIGQDTLPTLHTWHQASALLEKACFLVAPRFEDHAQTATLDHPTTHAGSRAERPAWHWLDAGGGLKARGTWISTPPWALSASWVRSVIARGGDASPWLHPAVWALIQTQPLYGCSRA